jgi:hypothetical protein
MYFKNTESTLSFADIAPFNLLDRNRAIGVPMDQPSPDHSTFSLFRTQLSKEAMKAINHELLSQYSPRGLIINEGIAIDARLVRSASHPIIEDMLKEQRIKRETPEGCLDKQGKPAKFPHGLNSVWTVRNQIPHFGLKEHTSVDARYVLVLGTSPRPPSMTASSSHFGSPAAVIPSIRSRRSLPTRAIGKRRTVSFCSLTRSRTAL